MKDLIHQLTDDFGGRGQERGLVLRLTGLQDGVQVQPAVDQVLAHAQKEAVQVVTQLNRLLNAQSPGSLMSTKYWIITV